MRNDIQRLGKPPQNLIIPIPIKHLLDGPLRIRIPPRAGVILAKVHRANDFHALSV